MANLTEDFNDATYVTPISGTWTRITSGGRSGGYLGTGDITSADGVLTATITIPSGATSVRLWCRGDFLDSGNATFEVLVNGAVVHTVLNDSTWTQTPALSLVGATAFAVRASSSSAFPGAAGIDDMVFSIPDAAPSFSGWGIPI